ncbi:MAG: hypothetical protein IPJ58_10315 [Ardenticatenia bacterium]|nr:hypothetical protein [Ardenticatenia bacterium]
MTPHRPWTRRDSLVALALLLLPLLVFQPLLGLVGARTYLAEGDFIDQFMAFAGFAVRELAEGRLPLWNPYAYGGAPFWADIQSAVAYPPNLLLYLAAAGIWGRLPLLALELQVLLHLGLSAALTYLFARRHLGDRGGALLAALCFGLGGYLTGYPMLQLAILEGVTWLPLLLWAIERAADGDAAADGGQQSAKSGARRPRPDPWQALALALVILAGHPQTALHVGYVGLAFALWRGRRGGSSGTDAPPLPAVLGEGAGGWGRDRGPFPRSLRPTATYLLSALLALLLSAPGWLPALDFMRRSTRASADYAMLSGGFPPAELLGALLPGLTHWSPLYLGLLPLVLALAAMGRWLRAEAGGDRPLAPAGDGMAAPVEALAPPAIWPILGLAALLLSLGRHAFAFDLFYLLAPGFDLFRGQERAAVAVSFSGAMLAGWALARWRRGDGGIGRAVALGGVAAAGLGALLAAVAAPELRAAAGRLSLLGLAAATLAGGAATGRLSRRALTAALMLLVLGDLYLATAGVNLQAGAPAELNGGAIVAALRESAPQRVENDHRLPPNFGMLHGVEATSGASPLKLAHWEALRSGLADQPARWWDLMAVSHVLTWKDRLDLPSERLLSQGNAAEPIYLHRLESAGPQLWWAASAEAVGDNAATLARLRDPDFPVFSRVLLHDGAPASDVEADAPAASARAQGSDVALADRGTGFVSARTQSSAPGWLVFSEVHDPGWRAWLDGAPAPVLRADLALVAVPVPAGEHEVLLRYTAPWVWRGIGVGLLGLALWLGLVVAGRRSGVAASTA